MSKFVSLPARSGMAEVSAFLKAQSLPEAGVLLEGVLEKGKLPVLLDELARSALSSPEAEERQRAIQLLTVLPAEDVSEILGKVLRHGLKDPSPRVREEAAKAWEHWEGSLGDGVERRLGRIALKDRSAHVRAAAVPALGLGRLPETVSVLSRLLRDANPDRRLSAAQALGNMQRPDACRVLLERLAESDVAEAAILLTGIAPYGKAARPALPRAREVARHCLSVVGKPDKSDSETELFEKLGVVHLNCCLYFTEAGERSDAALLCDLFVAAGKEVMSRRLAQPSLYPSDPVRSLAHAVQLGSQHSGEPDPLFMVSRLRRITAWGDPAERLAAVTLLSNLSEGFPEARKAVVSAMLTDSEDEVRLQAAKIAGDRFPEQALSAFCRALGDQSAPVRREAALTLSCCEPRGAEVAAPLRAALSKEADRSVAENLKEALLVHLEYGKHGSAR